MSTSWRRALKAALAFWRVPDVAPPDQPAVTVDDVPPTARAGVTPFFDCRDARRIKFALSVISFPDHFCLKEHNQIYLDTFLPDNPAVHHLVKMLRVCQGALAPHLPLPFEDVWQQQATLPADQLPATVCAREGLPNDAGWALAQALNRGLLECVLDRMPTGGKGVADPEAVRLALSCVWLSEHLALIALGVAKAELMDDGSLWIGPQDPDKAMHLRRLWFAAAFEERSLTTAQAGLRLYALLAARTPGIEGDLRDAFYQAVSLIPQHWRLPVTQGPVPDMLDSHLKPLIWLAGAVAALTRPSEHHRRDIELSITWRR